MIDDKYSRFVVQCMKEMYAGILKSIEQNGYDIFHRRAYVPTHKKVEIALKILLTK